MESVAAYKKADVPPQQSSVRRGSPPQTTPEIRSRKLAPSPRQQHPGSQFNLPSTTEPPQSHLLPKSDCPEARPTTTAIINHSAARPVKNGDRYQPHPFKRTLIPTPSCPTTMRAIYGVSWRIVASLRNGTTPRQLRTVKACCFLFALEISLAIPRVAIKSFTVLGKTRIRSFGWPGT